VKAFLLAGGRGERLRPLTVSCPKCLVPINGTPLLGIWLDRCRQEGIDAVLLNVSHHAGQVLEFLAGRAGPPRVELVLEAEPQGTAGTVSANRRFVEGEESFWIIYGDNLTNLSLRAMLATHRANPGVLTMALFRAPDPSAAGIVEVLPDGRIVSFEEKPKHPRSDLANAGIYLARAGLLDELPDAAGRVLDFGFHVLPKLVGRMYGHVADGFTVDIGTPEALAQASIVWAAETAKADL
jgi:mannose-1-phosphate guanylyltransferase